jgi:hypothetical protein
MFEKYLDETINSISGVETISSTATQHFHKYIEATYSYFFFNCDSAAVVHRKTKSNCLIDNDLDPNKVQLHLRVI